MLVTAELCFLEMIQLLVKTGLAEYRQVTLSVCRQLHPVKKKTKNTNPSHMTLEGIWAGLGC